MKRGAAATAQTDLQMHDSKPAVTAESGRRLARNVLWSYAAWSASAFTPLVTVPVCVRYLGNRRYGDWLIILSLASYLGLTNLGIAQTISNRIAEAAARRQCYEVRSLVATGFWTYAMVALVLIASLWSGAAQITQHWLHAASAPDVTKAFMVYVGLISLSLPGKIYQATLRGFERVDCEQALEAGSTLARTVLSALALAAGFKLVAIAWVNGFSALGAAILAYPLARRIRGAIKPLQGNFSWRCLHSLIRPSVAFLALQAGATLSLGIDNLVIGAALGATAVTRYAVPFRLIWMASLVFTVAVNAAMPTITGRYALDQRESLIGHYLIAMRAALLFATCGAILLWAAGPHLIGLWAGPGVYPGARVFALQIGLFTILVLTAPSRAILAATTNHYRYAAVTIGEGLLNLTLSLLWVRRYGLAGVIGGTIVASLFTTAWYVSVAAPAVIGLARRSLLRCLGSPVIVSSSALSAGLLANRSAGPRAGFVAWCVIAVMVLLAYLVVVFDADERRKIYRFLSRTLALRPNSAEVASVGS